jgi:hypothetical protein
LRYGARMTKNENGMYWWINPKVIKLVVAVFD